MLAIRLQRVGTKNRPSYRVVVSENKRDMYGRHNEILGNYDPVAQPKVISLKEDRIKYWLSVGAQPSATVHNLLVKQGVLEGKKIKAWKPKKKAVDEKAAAAQAPKPEAVAPAPKAEAAAAAPAPKAETPEVAGEKPAPEAPAEKAPATPAEAPKA